eukprot:scpid30388/ scgid0815/ Lysyl oxidase homolog 2A; Lysyl oxidase-like protein 2A
MFANRLRIHWSLMALLLILFAATVCVGPAHGQEHEETNRIERQRPTKLSVRLVGGPNALEGRVEVQHNGTWGTICDDNFDLSDGNVICRQLGFRRALRIIVGGKYRTTDPSMPTLLDEVNCSGDEKKLVDCKFTIGQHDCDPYHREDAGVRCYFVRRKRVHVPELLVRLQGGSDDDLEGYLQVFYRNRWGLVSGEEWSQINSKVVCGQMGYCDAEETSVVDETSSYFNFSSVVGGDRPFFWMKGVSCHGGESLLKDCRHLGFNGYYMLPAAKVRCLKSCRTFFQNGTERPQKVRLRGGARNNEGRLEVHVQGRWGTVCGTYFYKETATVACRQLGFGSVKNMFSKTPYGRGIGPVWLQDVNCRGNEGDLLDCDKRVNPRPDNQFYASCRHSRDVSIECRVPRFNTRVRVYGGRTASEGFVHIRHRAQWGGLCKNSLGRWTMLEANVACRDMGLGFAVSHTPYFPPAPPTNQSAGLVTHWIAPLRCTGKEQKLHHCAQGSKNSWIGARFCPQGEATVLCSKQLPDLIPDAFRLKSTLSRTVHRQRLVRLRCAMEENCLSSSASAYNPYSSEAYYVYRKLLRFSARIMNYGTADFMPSNDRRQWQWHSCHRHFHSFEEFTHYNISDEQGKLVVEGHKASFCLEDVECDPDTSRRFHCAHGTQGISVNCADVYRYDIDCQWVDVTDLNSGVFTLTLAVNPLGLVVESDHSNNVAWCQFGYERSTGVVTMIKWGLRDH